MVWLRDGCQCSPLGAPSSVDALSSRSSTLSLAVWMSGATALPGVASLDTPARATCPTRNAKASSWLSRLKPRLCKGVWSSEEGLWRQQQAKATAASAPHLCVLDERVEPVDGRQEGLAVCGLGEAAAREGQRRPALRHRAREEARHVTLRHVAVRSGLEARRDRAIDTKAKCEIRLV